MPVFVWCQATVSSHLMSSPDTDIFIALGIKNQAEGKQETRSARNTTNMKFSFALKIHCYRRSSILAPSCACFGVCGLAAKLYLAHTSPWTVPHQALSFYTLVNEHQHPLGKPKLYSKYWCFLLLLLLFSSPQFYDLLRDNKHNTEFQSYDVSNIYMNQFRNDCCNRVSQYFHHLSIIICVCACMCVCMWGKHT